MLRRCFLKLAALISSAFALNANAAGSVPDDKKSMEKLWNKYRKWLGIHFKEGIDTLSVGASEEQLSRLEASIGKKLPNDYRDWLQIHNGQIPDSVGLLYSNEFLSTSRLLSEWQVMNQLLNRGEFSHTSESEPADTIKPDWWNKNWLPISSDGSGNLVCIDLSPGAKGTLGQIIDFDHETVHRTLLAKSFREYISNYLNDLDSERYTYSDDYRTLVPFSDL